MTNRKQDSGQTPEKGTNAASGHKGKASGASDSSGASATSHRGHP